MELELLAFLASTLGVGSSLPQIIKIIKTRDTSALSLINYCMIFFSGIIWVIYGLLAPVYAIVFWNSVSTLLAGTIIYLKLSNEYFAKSKA